MHAKLLRQGMNARLGRVIDRVAAGEGIVCGDRRDADDVAAIALHHAGHEQSCQVQDGAQVDVDQLVDVVGGVAQRSPAGDWPALFTRTSTSMLSASLVISAVARTSSAWGNAARRLGDLGETVGIARDRMHFQPFGGATVATVAAPMPEEALVTSATAVVGKTQAASFPRYDEDVAGQARDAAQDRTEPNPSGLIRPWRR